MGIGQIAGHLKSKGMLTSLYDDHTVKPGLNGSVDADLSQSLIVHTHLPPSRQRLPQQGRLTYPPEHQSIAWLSRHCLHPLAPTDPARSHSDASARAACPWSTAAAAV